MEDAKILDLYFARDEDAIRETDTAYGKRLHTLAKNILQNREDAEESVNDTYAEVWKSIPPRRPKYFFAFLASICRHLSLNRVDWKQAAKRRAQVVPLTEEMENCIPDTVHERQMEAKELGRLLDLFLDFRPSRDAARTGDRPSAASGGVRGGVCAENGACKNQQRHRPAGLLTGRWGLRERPPHH